MYNIALYYPHIRVPEDKWLRTSLLLWDKIASIVPRGTEPKRNHISQKLREKGLIEFIDPMDHYKILQSISFEDGFKSLFKEERINEYLKKSAAVNNLVGENKSDGFTQGIHIDKLSREVQNFLINEHGASLSGVWIDCDPKIADLYMTYLASKITNIWNGNPLTNYPLLENLLDSIEDLTISKGQRATIASVVTEIEALIPNIPSDFSVERIIDFKNKHSKAYRRFKIELLNFRSSIANAQKPHDIDVLADQRQLEFRSHDN